MYDKTSYIIQVVWKRL